MNGINQVTLKGHLARDGEQKTMRDGRDQDRQLQRRYEPVVQEPQRRVDEDRRLPSLRRVVSRPRAGQADAEGRRDLRPGPSPDPLVGWTRAGNGKRYATEIVCKGSDVDILAPPLKKDEEIRHVEASAPRRGGVSVLMAPKIETSAPDAPDAPLPEPWRDPAVRASVLRDMKLRRIQVAREIESARELIADREDEDERLKGCICTLEDIDGEAT